MISVISPFGNKTIESLAKNTDEPMLRIRKIIMIQKINPEDYEDEENNMAKDDKFDDIELTDEELEKLEAELPANIDSIPDEELSDVSADELDEDGGGEDEDDEGTTEVSDDVDEEAEEIVKGKSDEEAEKVPADELDNENEEAK